MIQRSFYGSKAKRASEIHPKPSPRAATRGWECLSLTVSSHPRIAARGLGLFLDRYTFFMNVTRPVCTHSTTKILPSLSKQASCGCTNLPGFHSFSLRRISNFLSARMRSRSSPRCDDHLVVLVEQRDAGVQVGHQQHFAADVEMRGEGDVLHEADVLAVEREVLQAALARSATTSDASRPGRLSSQSPCGVCILPGSLPEPPQVRTHFASLSYWWM